MPDDAGENHLDSHAETFRVGSNGASQENRNRRSGKLLCPLESRRSCPMGLYDVLNRKFALINDGGEVRTGS
jgi:hypothetical protein